ncbi:MAG: hypothetical protein FWB96_07720 [Defluviitaleaceae bacterium]|nr:hypothetical protein [Defluviitaleaceae bacterium]MCL2262876.1 hypothetical protein [Defluviitaleaceae bacterium]
MTHLKTEFAKLRKMTFEEQRWYVWEYYKLHIGAFILLSILIGSFINAQINPRPPEYLYIAWDGVPAQHWQLSELSDKLEVITPENQRVTVTNYTMTDNAGQNNALQARFTTLLFLGDLDIYITTRMGAHQLVRENFARPVDEVRNYMAEINPQIHATLHERLYAAESADYMAISLEGSPLLESLGIDTSDIFLCVFENTSRFYEIAKALEVLLYGA